MPKSGKTKLPKTTLRNATLEDVRSIKTQIRYSTKKFFGEQDLEDLYRSSCYTLVAEYEDKNIASFVNFENSPNISAVPRCSWLSWMRNMYNVTEITYENTLFITMLYLDDPYNSNLLRDIFREIFLREPKLRFLCTVGPPVDSFYEDSLAEFCRQIYSTPASVSRLAQSISVCERYTILPKMRLRRALAEDNDDLVEIIDEKMKQVREKLGDFYIAEQVLRDNPNETIIVAEISNVTIGMIWINANINRISLATNFETSSFENFLQPTREKDILSEVIHDVIKRKSNFCFEYGRRRSFQTNSTFYKGLGITRLSLSNLYDESSETESSYEYDDYDQDMNLKAVFQNWDVINKRLRSADNYAQQVEKVIKVPRTAEATNAFAIRLHGLSKNIDPRRIFDLVAGAFAAHPDKDYCLISLKSTEASSDSLNGPLLECFARVIPRANCTITDHLYVTHKNSLIGTTEVDFVTSEEDIVQIEKMMCFSSYRGQQMYLPEIIKMLNDVLTNPWSQYHALIIRSAGCPIGFVIMKQDLDIDDFQRHYVLFREDEEYMIWEMGELLFLQVHPAFVWQVKYLVREIFRLTYYNAMHFRFFNEFGKPVFNSLVLAMYPIFARKQAESARPMMYSLYYSNMKELHAHRYYVEDKIVVFGFSETTKGFLKSLFYSDKVRYKRFTNVCIVNPCPGFIEAEYDTKTFSKGHMMFFKPKNQFDDQYLRMLEFRMYVTFVAGKIKFIDSEAKVLYIENSNPVVYDTLFLMSTVKYNAPKALKNQPLNFMTMNSRLDKIILFQKIKVLVTELSDYPPILVYGHEVMTHECVAALIALGIPGAKIAFVLPRFGGNIEFPDDFDDSNVINMVFQLEREAGVMIYENLKFVDWHLYPSDHAIQNCIFESDLERIMLPCSMFISYYTQAKLEALTDSLLSANIDAEANHILVDEYSRTNIPNIYACGRMAEYREHLFAKPHNQYYANQIEVGEVIGANFVAERCEGEKRDILRAIYQKPICKQVELISGLIYCGVSRWGRYVPRDIRKKLRNYGLDLITEDDSGEFCRLSLDKHGIITEIACITRKYKSLEIMKRIYGYHESLFDNLKLRYDRGEISSLLDYFHQGPFLLVLHDQFKNVKQKIDARHLNCLKDVLKNSKKGADKDEIYKMLDDQNVVQSMEEDIAKFIQKYPNEHARYAVPKDFEEFKTSNERDSTKFCE